MEKIKVGKINSVRRHRVNRTGSNEIEERKQMCMNALLNRSWIDKHEDEELYYWIKEQYFELRDWFTNYTGYTIIMNRHFIKLEKVPAVAFPWMGFSEFSKPLDYALFTYSLWYLENKTENEQFLLTQLVIEIRQHMVEQEMDVDWGNYYHRLSMARALKKLKSLKIVQAVDGEESNWVNDTAHHDVLYECTPYSRYILRNFPVELSSYTNMEDLKDTIIYGLDTKEKALQQKHNLYRRFLLEPILLNHQWQDDISYLRKESKELVSQLKIMFGWEGSQYREGIIFFESHVISESETFPTQSALSDLALLVCGEIRSMVTDPVTKMQLELDGLVRLTKHEIERILIHLKAEHGEFWTNEHKSMDSAVLAEALCNHLEEWRFGHWEDHMFFVLNGAGGRWEVKYGITEQVD